MSSEPPASRCRASRLSEIESSSRLRTRDGALYLSAPLIYSADSDQPTTTPVGFVLSRERLITVRFQDLTILHQFHHPRSCGDREQLTSAAVFAGLMDAITDRLADVLENIAAELDTLVASAVSHPGNRAGGAPAAGARKRRSADDAAPRRPQRRSRLEDPRQPVRDRPDRALRRGLAADWLPPEVKPRLDTVRQDVVSLSDYDAHLVNKVQLLLDATLGLINVEQNNIIKVLTIVSVVGIPPTLVASMYGMNFKDMPELTGPGDIPTA